MDLTGQNICVLDLETLKSASDCLECGKSQDAHQTCISHDFAPIGWHRKVELGLSIGCYYDYQDTKFYWFDRPTLATTMKRLVDRQPLMVSFNGIGFDFPLMRGLLRREAEASKPGFGLEEWAHDHLQMLCDTFKALCATSYDILAEIWKADPARKFEPGLNSLDAISQANGYGAKEMDGATAPRLWAQGRYAEVIQYNVGDVLKTKALFERIVYTAEILRGDGQPITLAWPTLPGALTEPPTTPAPCASGERETEEWH